jgi:D-sedoheptulose 7-phosphate isomerase
VSALNHDRPRAALGAIALTTDSSFLTANANDFGFEQVFERQVEALGRRGDVLLGITTSGNSANVLRALTQAKRGGLATVVLTGESGGKAAPLADVAVKVPSADTQHIQETHIAVGHILCALVERAMFG